MNLGRGITNIKNVSGVTFGCGSIEKIKILVEELLDGKNKRPLFIIDHFFCNDAKLINKLPIENSADVIWLDTNTEPTTEGVDKIIASILANQGREIGIVVGVGGGSTLDTAKAISNLLRNSGPASMYQGWDRLEKPGVFKVGVPTISGTGAESTRTCVMTNKQTGVKLGMNSHYSVFDHIVLDPDLTSTVPKSQYFYTAMDSYIHSFESLCGKYRNPIGDTLSATVVNICNDIFLSDNMMSDENREKLMVASYLGGCAVGAGFVGLVHPLSAGLSVVLGTKHCIGNCIVMRAMRTYYPEFFEQFWRFTKTQGIDVPENICGDLDSEDHVRLYESSIVHEKPLSNAMGQKFRDVLTLDVVKNLYLRM